MCCLLDLQNEQLLNEVRVCINSFQMIYDGARILTNSNSISSVSPPRNISLISVACLRLSTDNRIGNCTLLVFVIFGSTANRRQSHPSRSFFCTKCNRPSRA